jgi:transposase-like protein
MRQRGADYHEHDTWDDSFANDIAAKSSYRSGIHPSAPSSSFPRPTVVAPSRPSLVDPRLEELIERLGVDAGANAYLEELRWPDGVTCVRCGSPGVRFIKTRMKHECRDCRYQFRVTAGTVLHDSHVPAHKWLLAVRLMLEYGDGFPANRLWEVIGGSYKTSWFVEHRVRAAMAQALLDDDRVVMVALARAPDWTKAESHHRPLAYGTEPAPQVVVRGLRLLKQLAGSAYHCPSLDHLGAYWAETRWRMVEAGAADAYRATVIALLTAGPTPYRQLTRHPGHRPAVSRA